MGTSVRKENKWRKTIQEHNNRRHDLRREMEAAFMERKTVPAPQKSPQLGATRRQVRRWMRDNAVDYEGMTQLVEAANCTLRLPDGALDDDTHWVWDEAFEAYQ